MAVRSGLRLVPGTDLAGRDWELSLLVQKARDAALGEGQAVLLRGPAGIGKTKLVAAALDELDTVAATVLTVTCPESGSSAYEAVRALFAPLDLSGGLLDGSARLAVPALEPGGAGTAADTYAVMHGLHWLTAGLTADGLVVLAVDDVQWCDETSLRWLGFLLRRAENLPLLVVMTQRTGRDVPRPEVLGEIGATLTCLTLDLEPLGPGAVAEVLQARFGANPADEFVRKCVDVTGGNPFLLDRVVTQLRGDAVEPDATHVSALDEIGREVVARSVLDRLSPEAFAVARAIAVLGGEEIELIAALAGTQPGPAAAAVRALRADDLLLPDRLDYTHDLIRHAVVDAVSAEQLQALRERAATLLNDNGRAPEEVAVQLLLLSGRPQPWMVNVLRDAAVVAENRGAPAAAARYLTRALAADEDSVAVLGHVARVLAQVDPQAALRHLERALELVTDPRRRVPLAVQYALTSLTAQNSLRAYALAESVLDRFDEAVGDAPSAQDRSTRTLLESVLLLSGMDEKDTVRQVGERFRDVVPPRGDTAEERQLLAMLSSLGTVEGRPAAEVGAYARKVLSIGDVTPGGWGVLGAVLTLYLADDVEPALAALGDLMDHAQRRGEAWTYTLGASTRALVFLWIGNSSDALSDAQFAYDIITQEAWGDAGTMPQAALAAALVRHGEPARALRVLDSVRRPRLERFTLEYHWVLMARARALAAGGDPAAALTHLLLCRDSLAEAGLGNPVLAPWWYDAAEVLTILGRGDEGWAGIEEAEDRAARWGTPRAVGMVRTARGVLTPGDAGIELLTEATELLAPSPAKLEHARAEFLLGRRLFRRGDAEGARDRLRRSIDVAVLCRDKLQVNLSLPALAEAGGRMRRGTASPADALSGSERRVAEKAAEGATNREIAESLFLTVRTVELHLTGVYRKLGLKGRAELAEALDLQP
ncbi:AAA family ATPase [Amycolatopsis rhabdoformis]|uniref:AAA family ATPase n=1 Tax=Amycolatopsis rhabdoformis TaxID=1448059 RepID=A0ABZ1IGR0_9PSEU|nr:AAA family ATPase [Amycolatopsis rhabdoformis]WSE32903.1 AAA family ATPase [Amycolatopsis rhabdoformis]